MSGGAPLTWIYEAGDDFCGFMRPVRRDQKRADDTFVFGIAYRMEVVETAQSARDKGYHARMKELWANLPEEYDGQFPGDEDFRKWCLIECGYSTKVRSPCPNEASAQAVVPLIIALQQEFCQVEAVGDVVVVTRALSQKLSEARGGMSADRRHQSYKDTEEFARQIVGVSERELAQNAGRSA